MARARASNGAAPTGGPCDARRADRGASLPGRMSLLVAILPPAPRRGCPGRDRLESAVRLFWGLLAVPLHGVEVGGARPSQPDSAGVRQRGRRADRVRPLGTAFGPRTASGG